jgi:hypothetical protein
MVSPELSLYLTEAQTAQLVSVSLSTLRRWRKARTGPTFFQLGNIIRYCRHALDDFIERNSIKTA